MPDEVIEKTIDQMRALGKGYEGSVIWDLLINLKISRTEVVRLTRENNELRGKKDPATKDQSVPVVATPGDSQTVP